MMEVFGARRERSAVKRSMMLALGGFGREAIEEHARRYTLSMDALLGRAAEYYVSERGSERVTQRLPRFRREPAAPRAPVEIDLEPEVWEALQKEARRQGVPVERVLEHAALRLVADLDSGRVASRILEDEGD
jgi:hypothetical protein